MIKIKDSDIHIGDIVRLEAALKGFGEKFPYMVVQEIVQEKICLENIFL